MITLQAVRAHVRAYLDLDATDLSDLLLDSWTADAFRRIIRSTRNWPQLEVSTSLSVVSGTADYAFPSSGDDPLEDITSIVANQRVLRWLAEADLVRFTASGTSSGEPDWFSTWGNQIRLWPTPSASVTATVYGRRKPRFSWLVTITEEIDLPDDHEGPLLSWVLCEAFKQQNDTPMASNFAQDFQVKLDEINSSIVNTPSAGPLILNGGSNQSSRFHRGYLLPYGF